MKLREKFAYGLGAVGKDMVYMLSASYVLYYYQDLLGVSAWFMGILLLAARVFDAINDPIMGVVVAKTRTRFGRFRPWIFSGTVLNAVVLYAMFAVPESLGSTGMMVYGAITYTLWGMTYTMMDIPYWSMIPAFAKTSKERESMSTLGRTCAGLGSAIVTILTMKAVVALGGGNERLGFKLYTLIMAAFFVLTAVLMCLTIKEKSSTDMPTTSVKDMFRALIKNDQAMTVVIAIVLINCSIYLTSNLVIYFFKYDFGGKDWYDAYTLFNTFGGAMQILAMMLVYPLLRKFLSNIAIFRASLCMAILGYVSLLLLAATNMSNVFLLFIPGFFIFAANGLFSILTTLFLANSVDYGEVKNGRRDESVIFSMQTFVVKLASGVAALLASACLAIFKIGQSTDIEAVMPAQSVTGLRLTMTLLPILGLIIAGIYFARKFILTDEKTEELAKTLNH